MRPQQAAPLSLTIAVADIGRKGRTVRLEADADQRAMLAKELAIAAIERLSGEFYLTRVGGGCVHLRGRLQADVVQRCVVSLAPVKQHIDETLTVTLLPAETAGGRAGAPVLVDPMDEEDRDTYCDGCIDLGVIVSEQLALNLDPYPRAAGAQFNAVESAETGGRDSPFAVLERLKRRRR